MNACGSVSRFDKKCTVHCTITVPCIRVHFIILLVCRYSRYILSTYFLFILLKFKNVQVPPNATNAQYCVANKPKGCNEVRSSTAEKKRMQAAGDTTSLKYTFYKLHNERNMSPQFLFVKFPLLAKSSSEKTKYLPKIECKF